MRFAHGHLAYCTNIHPAEDWESTLRALKQHAMKVRDLVSTRDEAFAIGLRLSARAADELVQADHLPRFRDWLEQENAYVFTINGFPYGNFHGTRVKRDVFRPDWSDPARVSYTRQLFEILSQIVPDGIEGSVSTLPGSFKEFGADETIIRRHLLEMADFLEDLSEKTSRDLHLGLEPEPRGLFENTPETLDFFERLLSDAPSQERVLKRIGLNYDCCHFALQYEKPAEAVTRFIKAGIRFSKIHLSSALRIEKTDEQAVEILRAFDEPTYLHQVIAKSADGTLQRFTDLPLAFAQPELLGQEWRVHFHIPLDASPQAPLASTAAHAEGLLELAKKHVGLCQHWEIETYTWGVLPNELQRPVEQQIAAEYSWVLARS